MKKQLSVKGIDKKLKRLKVSMHKAKDAKRKTEIAAMIGDLEKQRSELTSDKQADKINKRFKEVEDAAKIPETFMLPNGTMVFMPKKIIESKYDEIVFTDADESIQDWFPSAAFIEEWREKGDFILVLKRVNPNPALSDCVPILFKAIVSARTQRFRMIELVAKQHGKEKILNLQAELIRSALGDKISKRIKKDKTIIDKYLDAFLECRNPRTICSDMSFICQTT
jgi:hypothetical protein